MRLIVDADVLIDVFRGVAPAIDLLAAARRRGDTLASVTPVRTEILRGVEPRFHESVSGFLRLLDWIAVDSDLADRAGALGSSYVRSHQGISITDLLLAAAAERLDGRLLTRNVRHFPMIPGLRPAY